jgi:hypothetical protein
MRDFTTGVNPFGALEAQVLRQQAVDHQVDARGDYWLKRSAYLRAVAREGIIR